MKLKDISYSGLLKLALLFIVAPRTFLHIYAIITRPLIANLRAITMPTNQKLTEATEANTQQVDFLSETILKEVVFIITLLISVFVLTKVIEFLAQNTKLGDMHLGESPK